MQEPFDRFLSDEDREVLEVYGHDNAVGVGVRPAVLVVDATYAFVGEAREPVAYAARRRRTACGVRAWQAIDRLQGLLDTARAKGLPIIYTKGGANPDLQRLGAPALKKSRPQRGAPSRNLRDGNEIVDEIAPRDGDIVIAKGKPSAFFGTPLLSFLVALKVDSLFIVGGATSGCVRASVVDAFSNNYGCALVADCCFDRFEASHEMSLFDLGAKYAAVTTADKAIDHIWALGPFRSPAQEQGGA